MASLSALGRVLAAFCGAPQRVLSRDQLLGLSRLHNAEVYDRTIDVQILRLRRRCGGRTYASQGSSTSGSSGSSIR